MSDLNNRIQDPTTVDIRCSTACARSAVTALLLSAIAISMIHPLKEIEAVNMLSKYVSLRDMLKIERDNLEKDTCWIHLKNKVSSEVLKDWSLNELLKYDCKDLSAEFNKKKGLSPENEKPDAAKKTRSEIVDNVAPSAPMSLQNVYKIPNIVEISEIMFKLGNLELIKLARSTSYKYDRQIYQWELLRYRILTTNMGYLSTGKGVLIGESNQDRPKMYAEDKTSFNEEALLRYLTFDNVNQLTDYKMPDSNDLTFLLRDRGQFKLPTLNQPIGFAFAILFTEIGLTLSVFYFWMYQREAQSSPSYPAPGTLFGVFSRSRLSRLVFIILTIVPPFASILLATYPKPISYFNIVPAILVTIFCFFIALESKMYKIKSI